MNDFLSLAQKRYAVRSYLPKPVEAEKLERILEAGCVAPTAKNTQPFRFLVVQHPERLKKLSACTNVKGYPLAIIVCSVASEVWVRPFDGKSKPDTDAAIAATHMLLEATDLGLGSCWLMHFDPTPIREQFRIPEGTEPEYEQKFQRTQVTAGMSDGIKIEIKKGVTVQDKIRGAEKKDK